MRTWREEAQGWAGQKAFKPHTHTCVRAHKHTHSLFELMRIYHSVQGTAEEPLSLWSFRRMDPENGTQVVRLGGRPPYLQKSSS